MHDQFGKISTRSSLVPPWIYEAGVILIVIRLGSNLYLKDRGLNSYRAYPFLQLLGYIIMFFSIFSVTYKLY